MDIEFSESWNGSTRFRNLNAHSKVIDWWKADWPKRASHIETRNDLCRSVVINVQMCSKENKAAMDMDISKIQESREENPRNDSQRS